MYMKARSFTMTLVVNVTLLYIGRLYKLVEMLQGQSYREWWLCERERQVDL